MKKSSIAILFSALSLIATFSAYAQMPEKMLPLAVEVEVITVFVMDVDLQNRTIELKDTNGNLMQMKVSKQIKDLENILEDRKKEMERIDLEIKKESKKPIGVKSI